MIIVEDGTLVTNSNSYLTVAEADAYHTLYGNLDWAGDDSIKEQALILATQSIDSLYYEKFLSCQISIDQSLEFPRFLAGITNELIPTCLKHATAEVALMQLNGVDIFPTPNTDNNLKSKTIEISGGPKKALEWVKTPQSESYVGFNKIDLLLKRVLKKSDSNTPLNLSL